MSAKKHDRITQHKITFNLTEQQVWILLKFILDQEPEDCGKENFEDASKIEEQLYSIIENKFKKTIEQFINPR